MLLTTVGLPWYFIVMRYLLLAFHIGTLKIQLIFKTLFLLFILLWHSCQHDRQVIYEKLLGIS